LLTSARWYDRRPDPGFDSMMTEHVKRQLAVIIAALLIPIVPFVIIGELPGEQWLSATDDDALTFALTGGGLLAADILLPVPSSIVATLLAARLGFLLARFAFKRLQSWLPPFPESTTLALVFLSRPVPVVAEATALAAGATGIPVLHFLLVCAGGNFVYAIILAGNGAAFVPGALAGPGLAVPMLLPVVAWFAWRRFASRRHADGDAAPE
jgi:uncharacterized membrane protein YdjX (TVP38/TMEM64 family)